MGYDRGRRGRGRDKRDGFGEETFDPFQDGGSPQFGGGDRFSGGGSRFSEDRGSGGGFRGGGGGSGGGFRGGGDGGAPRGGGMPAQVVGTGQGKVKFFNAQKGFGFIQRDDGGEDIFVHISQVERSGLHGINQGDLFEFDLEVDRRGKYSAVNLVPVQG